MRRYNSGLLFSALLLAGCAHLAEYIKEPSPEESPLEMSVEDYHTRYRSNTNPWLGEHVSKLVAEYGAPDVILETKPKGGTFRNGIHRDSYIYYKVGQGANPCVSVYVVLYDSGFITDYYCR